MTVTNEILSDAQQALLTAALNCIVPATGEMPGAGDLGVVAFVESVASASSSGRRRLLDGLLQIELAATEQGGSFVDLPDKSQISALQTVEAANPEFFRELVTQTYRGYYTDKTVCGLISYRAPSRADYNPDPFDELLLEPVRQRGQIWKPSSSDA